MSSLSFPDINVWLALATPEHVHHDWARQWWRSHAGLIGFSRVTQIGFLRLMTTAAAMDRKPLTMVEAWEVYDRLFEDDRVAFFAEPAGLEDLLRSRTARGSASPKVWADAYLLSFARLHDAVLVTFDQALAREEEVHCLVLPMQAAPRTPEHR